MPVVLLSGGSPSLVSVTDATDVLGRPPYGLKSRMVLEMTGDVDSRKLPSVHAS